MNNSISPPKVIHDDVPVIQIPHGVTMERAAKYCAAAAAEEQAITVFNEHFPALPFVAAHALEQVLKRHYSATRGKSGAHIAVQTSKGSVQIWWGTWDITASDIVGTVTQRATLGDEGVTYVIAIEAKRLHEPGAKRLIELLRTEVAKRELYSGSALLLQPDANGDLEILSPPKVVALQPVSVPDLILPDQLSRTVFAELFLPIMEQEKMRIKRLKLRRGVLLAGRPGTGKSMAATVAAGLAVANGWTVFYLPDSRAFEAAVKIATSHQPALLVIEDIDRQVAGDRNAEVDRILNVLSGLDSTAQIMLVCTTNDASDLPAPLLRPGRLDSFMVFDLPDAKAAESLLRKYLKDDAPEDLVAAGKACSGLLPACIQEVAERSILHAMAAGRDKPSGDDIRDAAASVRKQQEAIEKAENRPARIPKRGIHVVHDMVPELKDQRRDSLRALAPVDDLETLLSELES